MDKVSKLYDIEFHVDNNIGVVTYDNHGIPRTRSGLPGWWVPPVMTPEIARELSGKRYPYDITYESWKKDEVVKKLPIKVAILTEDNSTTLDKVVEEVFDFDPPAIKHFLSGKLAALGILINLVKEKSNADPRLIRARIEELLQKRELVNNAINDVIDSDPPALGEYLKGWQNSFEILAEMVRAKYIMGCCEVNAEITCSSLYIQNKLRNKLETIKEFRYY